MGKNNNNIKHSIAIADDHILIAKAIGSVIDRFSNYEVLFEVENGSELITRLGQVRELPDIILLDISMPVMDGFATMQWLREHHPGIKVMALTMQGDDESLIKMIRSGASGYLNKNVHPSELNKALDAIVTKGYYYPEWATSRVFQALSRGEDHPEPGINLSAREKEFLKFACTELTYKEIGEKMICSPRTVESYRDSLFEKLGVKTRVALALYAVKSGLHTIE